MFVKMTVLSLLSSMLASLDWHIQTNDDDDDDDDDDTV